MKIYRIPSQLTFLFKDNTTYQVICELKDESTSGRVGMKKAGAIIRHGYNGIISSYLKELMYLADTKIPVLTAMYGTIEESTKILDARKESLEIIEGVEVLEFSQNEIFSMIWEFMKKNGYSIHAVAAVTNKGHYIGDGKNQYFYIKEDLKHFKELTKDSCCICGYNTYMTLPQHRLPGRKLFVITSKSEQLRKYNKYPDDVSFSENPLDAIIYWLLFSNSNILYNIGGESLYKFLDPITKFYHITRIIYHGINNPWKVGDRQFRFGNDITGSHKKQTLTEISKSDWLSIPEYMKGDKLCTDPLEIQFNVYQWKEPHA